MGGAGLSLDSSLSPSPRETLGSVPPKASLCPALHPLLSLLGESLSRALPSRGGAQQWQCPPILGNELLHSQGPPGDPRLWAGISLSTLPLWGATLLRGSLLHLGSASFCSDFSFSAPLPVPFQRVQCLIPQCRRSSRSRVWGRCCLGLRDGLELCRAAWAGTSCQVSICDEKKPGNAGF